MGTLIALGKILLEKLLAFLTVYILAKERVERKNAENTNDALTRQRDNDVGDYAAARRVQQDKSKSKSVSEAAVDSSTAGGKDGQGPGDGWPV
jgi:uncharacterized membrane protein